MLPPKYRLSVIVLLADVRSVGSRTAHGDDNHRSTVWLQPQHKARNYLWTDGLRRSKFSAPLYASRRWPDYSVYATLETTEHYSWQTSKMRSGMGSDDSRDILLHPTKSQRRSPAHGIEVVGLDAHVYGTD
jgi:hypothetical protein